MKISLFTLAFSTSINGDNEAPVSPSKTPRRFADFKRMFNVFFSHDDLMKIYGYGCYCLNLGDRPLSGMMSGVIPVDDVDEMCFRWTKCNRCATIDYGETCSPESVKYRFTVRGDDDIICQDPEGSCANALCKCDRNSVINLRTTLDGLSADSEYLSHNGFNAEEQCTKRPVTRNQQDSNMQCCGQYPRRFPFNAHQKQCCDDKIMSINSC